MALWQDNEIIEGHGRLLAVMEMDDIKQVPIIRLDDLTDEQRKAYMLVHNKLTMNTDFNFELLNLELEDITEIDMSEFGFLETDLDSFFSDDEDETEPSSGSGEATYKIVCLCSDALTRDELIDYLDNHGIIYEV